ncbi:MAG TPA: hypothetical protein VFZ73_09960 [Gemmatimonadaceae bacterium]
MYRGWLVLLLMLGIAPSVQAQRISLDSVSVADTSVRHIIRLRDGSTLVGRITAITGDSVRVRLEQGEVGLARSGIEQVQQVPRTALRNGQYWFENPHSTRLLFSSTAFPLEKGTGYYANAWLFAHTFAAGVTDRFTLGGGLTTVPGIAIHDNPVFLLPKYTVISGSRLQVALGALIGMLPFNSDVEDNFDTAGLLYGVGTTGTRESNLSLGLAWGYANDQVTSRPAAMVGGQHRMSRRISLISENWFFPDGDDTEGVVSYGLRFLGENISVDLAWVTVLDSGGVGIPWLGFAFRF